MFRKYLTQRCDLRLELSLVQFFDRGIIKPKVAESSIIKNQRLKEITMNKSYLIQPENFLIKTEDYGSNYRF